MNLKLIIKIAVKHLVSKKKQSVVAMLGVTFGISMFIIMISFMTGVNKFMDDIAMDNTPHVHVYKPLELQDTKIIASVFPRGGNDWFMVAHRRTKQELPRIKDAMKLLNQIEKDPDVAGVAPQVASQVFYNNGSVQIPGNIFGIDVNKQERLFSLGKKMDFGDPESLLKGSDLVLMGKGLAKKMNVGLGGRISVTTPGGGNIILRVVGIFSFGISAMDEDKCYASIGTVQKILQKDPSYITDLNVRLVDVRKARAYTTQLKKKVSGLRVEDWETASASLLAGDKIRGVMTTVVCITLLIVAGFGIYNIMNMNIMNKMKDIAILKATGFQGSDVTAIFLLQSVIIGIAGGLLGLGIGFFFSFLLSRTPFPEAAFFRIKTFPVMFNPVHYLAGIFFGFLTTLFAGYFPSKKASKIDPVQIIRG